MGANKPEPKIRQYKTTDLSACRALWVELTEWHRQIYQSPGIGGANPGLQFDEHLAKVSADNIWVAEVDNVVVGLTGLILEEGQAELEPLVVGEPYRGLGIGRQLAKIVQAAAQARGVRQLSVRPVARNAQAIQFFHNMGFTVLGHIELFMDFGPEEQRRWQVGERLAGKDFLV